MASLTESAVVVRKAIKYGAIGFVAISLLWYLGGAGIKVYKRYFPAALPSPLAGFGKLEKLKFPEETTRPEMLLELPTGEIPTFPDRMTVYSSPLERSTFLKANKAIEQASKLGFTFKPVENSKTEYIWDTNDSLSSKLIMNIITGHFRMTKQWQNDPELARVVGFKSDAQVLSAGVGLLRISDVLPDDILGEEKISYLKAEGDKLALALALSDADFVQIDFYRKNIEEIDEETKEVLSSYPFYRPTPRKGLVRLILSGSDKPNEKLILLENNYTEIDYTKMSTYQIKTGLEAWEELKNGGGFVTNDSPDNGTIKIRRMFLGYFDGGTDEYTMPVYVFLGDKNFVAYVSAITDEWLK
jgi:hypothetical protein